MAPLRGLGCDQAQSARVPDTLDRRQMHPFVRREINVDSNSE
jgi:hypothetical protein